MRDYYSEIDKAIKSYEDTKPYHEHDFDWICNRIDWCWKYRKITRDQMIDLTDRIINVMESYPI